SIQQVLSEENLVGRLSFLNDSGYEAYVAKVLKWEKAQTEKHGGAKIYTVRDGTAATTVGHDALMSPLTKYLTAAELPVQSFAREVPDQQELLDAVKTQDPSVLFTMSHGVGPPKRGWKDYETQTIRQGSMSF